MKKIVAFALSVVMVLACFCVFAVADDEAVKIPVYKINPEYYYEGCVAIYTHERGDVLGQEGQTSHGGMSASSITTRLPADINAQKSFPATEPTRQTP